MTALCYRCEHRALFLEMGKHRPRCQCGEPGAAVFQCYMYKPTKPMVVTAADKKDPRPIFGTPMIAGRVRAVRVACGNYHLKETNDGNFIAWFWPSAKED